MFLDFVSQLAREGILGLLLAISLWALWRKDRDIQALQQDYRETLVSLVKEEAKNRSETNELLERILSLVKMKK